MSDTINNEVIVNEVPKEEVVAVEEKISETKGELKTTLLSTKEVNVEKESVTEEVPQENKSWLNNLGAEYKENNYLKGFEDKSLDDFVKSAINAQALIGKRVNDYSKEDIEGFYTKLGKPESYTTSDTLDMNTKDVLIDAASDANLTQEQFNKLADKINISKLAAVDTAKINLDQTVQDAELELRKEFGDAYDKRLALAEKAILNVFDEDVLKFVKESDLGSNPTFLKGMSKIGLTLSEDTILPSDKAQTFGTTPNDALRTIDANKADIEFMQKYRGEGKYKKSEANKKAILEMENLFQLAYSQ